MKGFFRSLGLPIFVLGYATAISSFCAAPGLPGTDGAGTPSKHTLFPYKQAGLTERMAAAHLLNRFTYGATPGQIDAVVGIGLEKWFEEQLNGGIPDDSLNQLLGAYDAIGLSNAQVVNTYPRNGEIIRMAVKDGVIDKDSVKTDKKEYKDQLKAYMEQKGFKPIQELYRQFICQKIIRAAYTNNQLQEVMTDFWFNHFNVSVTKNDCASFIPAYERDVIRPNALGSFGQLLLATAQSPAMLYYLDNFSSAGVDSTAGGKFAVKKKNKGGINENYAREVMELHTLGVDGGYTQNDVTQAARVLTGWTVYPLDSNGYGGAMRKLIDRVGEDNLQQRGFVHQGDFLFAANRHDEGEKTVLGKHFEAGGGYQEGVDLLDLLAHHPSTARFITRKLAVRFVSDNPPASLLDKMTKTFLDKKGDIREVLLTMVNAPEFWSSDAVREKIKSPFELAISAVRGLHARIDHPYPLYQWVTRMGQKMYFYQAPTGFPDKGQYWINTGSLLNRMNFGLALANDRIPGTTFDLGALNNYHEPESAQAGLITYGKLLMPERNLDASIKRLTPLLGAPDLVTKVSAAAGTTQASGQAMGQDALAVNQDQDPMTKKGASETTMLAQVVGILIGSPEYQRR